MSNYIIVKKNEQVGYRVCAEISISLKVSSICKKVIFLMCYGNMLGAYFIYKLWFNLLKVLI